MRAAALLVALMAAGLACAAGDMPRPDAPPPKVEEAAPKALFPPGLPEIEVGHATCERGMPNPRCLMYEADIDELMQSVGAEVAKLRAELEKLKASCVGRLVVTPDTRKKKSGA